MPRYTVTQKRKRERQVWRELPAGSHVVIYGRHSPGESQTIHSQADAMRRWIEERDWALDREFYDESVEGSRTDRAAFQEMLNYVHQEPRPVDGVVVWNTSRFGRDQLDSQFYKADLRRRGYVVVGKEDGIEQSPLAPVLESMLEWKAQQDLAVIGADTKRGLEYLARLGYWPGGPLPMGFVREKELLGYRKNGTPRYGLRIRQDPAVAARVARAWELRLSGGSYREIHDEVALFRSVKCYSTFFSNALYAGVLEYGGVRYPAGWQAGERICEPYITLEQYGQVREQARAFASRTNTAGLTHAPRNRASSYLLSGLIVCGQCLAHGEVSTLVGWRDARHPTYACYRCGRKQRLRGAACQQPSLACGKLEAVVINVLRDTILTPDYLRAEVAQANAWLRDQGRTAITRLRRAEAAEQTARRALEHLGAFIASQGANPVITEQYRVAEREWQRASAAVAAANAERRASTLPQITEADARVFAAELAARLSETPVRERRRFLASLVRRIVVAGTEGQIELVDQPALSAARVAFAGHPREPAQSMQSEQSGQPGQSGQRTSWMAHLFGGYPQRDSNP